MLRWRGTSWQEKSVSCCKSTAKKRYRNREWRLIRCFGSLCPPLTQAYLQPWLEIRLQVHEEPFAVRTMLPKLGNAAKKQLSSLTWFKNRTHKLFQFITLRLSRRASGVCLEVWIIAARPSRGNERLQGSSDSLNTEKAPSWRQLEQFSAGRITG